jgi:hypothetical protein
MVCLGFWRRRWTRTRRCSSVDVVASWGIGSVAAGGFEVDRARRLRSVMLDERVRRERVRARDWLGLWLSLLFLHFLVSLSAVEIQEVDPLLEASSSAWESGKSLRWIAELRGGGVGWYTGGIGEESIG